LPFVKEDRGFSFPIDIGNLTINNYQDIFLKGETMRNSRISLITSYINMEIKGLNETLTNIITKSNP